MKVEIYSSPSTKFGKLPIGATFILDGRLYMVVPKCRSMTEYYIIYNAVDIKTADLFEFDSDTEVCQVEATAVVE